jgi:hypothetical protein
MVKPSSKPRLQLPAAAIKERPLIKRAVDVDSFRRRRDSQREPIAPQEKYQMALSNALLSFGS